MMSYPLPGMIETTCGKIKGDFKNGIYSFKGIPYAKPPIGELRWKPPQHHSLWTGVRDALQFGPAAPQPDSKAGSIEEFAVTDAQSEDCLYLNIWTPGPDNTRRPVMVWIHGGYFTMGAGSQSSFQGSVLAARENIVLVTINYRLGALGFLNLKEVTRGQISSTGNEGLLDQVAALQWVKSNISNFGGNPDNVTVFGESAGGTSIECLLTMPEAQGLFQKAILQSPMGGAIRPLANAVGVAEQWLQRLGIKGNETSDLREMPIEKLLAAQKEISSGSADKYLPFAPVIDGEIIPAAPITALKNGAAAGIPILAGTNREEMRLFCALNPQRNISETTLRNRVSRLISDGDVDQVIADYRHSLTTSGEITTPASILTAIQTDYMFRIPTMELLKARCRTGEKTFAYLFDWPSPARQGIFGACHGMEIGFVFGTYDAEFCGIGPEADRLSHQIQDAWASFARTGNTNCQSLGKWQQYCEDENIIVLK